MIIPIWPQTQRIGNSTISIFLEVPESPPDTDRTPEDLRMTQIRGPLFLAVLEG